MMKRIIQILISLIVVAALLYSIDLKETTLALSIVNFKYIIVAILVVTINRFIMAYKWNILLKANNVNIPLLHLVKIYYISNVLGLFLPATIGGDVLRLLYAAKKDNKKSEIIASIILERFLGFFILFLISFLGLIFFINFINSDQSAGLFYLSEFLLIIIIISFLLLIFSFSIYFNKLSDKIIRTISKVKLIKKHIGGIEKLQNSYSTYKKKPIVIIKFSFLTVLEISTVVLWCYFSILALQTNISFIYLTAIVPLIQMLVRLPISLDGFGIHEASYVYFFAVIGLPEFIGFSAGILVHFVTIVGILPGIYFYLTNKSNSKIIMSKDSIQTTQ